MDWITAALTYPRQRRHAYHAEKSAPLKCWRLKSTASSIPRQRNSDQSERGAGIELGDVRSTPKAAELLRSSEMA
jgi:hypothetical protein